MPRTDRLPLTWIILDGWGHRDSREHNAVLQCGARNMEELAARFPHLLLDASGTAVGLPGGYMGNSEVGHLCMGAGRTVPQVLGQIFADVESGAFLENPALQGAFDAAASSGGAVHLMGLVSDGGVHSHVDHAVALVRMARARECRRLFVHAFTDGRDTPPDSGVGFVEALERQLREIGIGRVAGVAGRYYAMDRDQRWDRVARAYAALVGGEGHRAPSGAEAVRAAYARGETDEFIVPTVVEEDGQPLALIGDGDSVLFFNFRPDRARELTRALTEPDFAEFPRQRVPALARFTCFTNYDETFRLPVAFEKQQPERVFGEVLASRGIRQVRCAETEKYAHVTYFFNGVRENTFAGEDRILVPSPRVPTYDRMPGMSAEEVIRRAEEALRSRRDQVLVVNFANADMVGHTGVYEATLEACRIVDGCVGRLVRATLELGGAAVVTADHGNAEMMVDPESGGPHTAHTTNPVPVILAGEVFRGRRTRQRGILADIAPTLLEVLELDPPDEMTGRSLFQGTG